MPIDLTEISNIPSAPHDEISRDNLIRRLAGNFKDSQQVQLLAGQQGSGKTNTLAQFARHFPEQTISYFVTDDPQTHRRDNYLIYMISQLDALIKDTKPNSASISHDSGAIYAMEAQLVTLCIKLQHIAKQERRPYYFVIDGLEKCNYGIQGERIIDCLPRTFRQSPYLLISWATHTLSSLPNHLSSAIQESTWPLGLDETRQYFNGIEFSENDVQQIHNRHGGEPGVLSIIKQTKLENPRLLLRDVLLEGDRILERQIDAFLARADEKVTDALRLLAVSPAPLPHKVLTNILGISYDNLVTELKYSRLVNFDKEERLQFASQPIRQVICIKLLKDKPPIIQQLIKEVQAAHPEEEFLLALLMRDAKDYDGLTSLLSTDSLITKLGNSQWGPPNAIQKLRLAAELAYERAEISDLFKWTLAISVIRSFSQHAIDTDEIEAQIALGESSEALKQVYSISEPTIRIRLLAKTYAAMRNNQLRIPKETLDELDLMVDGLKLDEFDKNLLEELAYDLFPVLPDRSLALLDHAKQDEVQLDGATLAYRDRTRSISEERISIEDTKLPPDIFKAGWLSSESYESMCNHLEALQTTKAKELYIRHWCRENKDNSNLPEAIHLWLDIVISDRRFTISLNNLGQISELLSGIVVEKRAHLVNRLRVPELISLRSPVEEWVRVRLNLADTLNVLDKSISHRELIEVYDVILKEEMDLDVRTFCLAQSLVFIKNILGPTDPLLNDAQIRFHKSLSELLESSAEHLDHLGDTITALVDFDPNYASIVSLELNTEWRRYKALHSVFMATMQKYGKTDVSCIINDIYSQLPKVIWDSILSGVISELASQKVELQRQNLDILMEKAKSIDDPMLRAYAITDLASLEIYSGSVSCKDALTSAIDSWNQIDDLRIRLKSGYSLTQSIASIDHQSAVEFYQKQVLPTKNLPGAPLASGELGSIYAEMIRLGLRSLGDTDVRNSSQTIDNYVKLIERVPSQNVQIELFAKLASSLYRIDNPAQANEIVHDKVVRLLNNRPDIPGVYELISETLPVVYEFDPQIAREIIQRIPKERRFVVWYNIAIWTIVRCFLGDQEDLNLSTLRIAVDYRRLRSSVEAASEIDRDYVLSDCLNAIIKTLSVSVESKIDPGQALDILTQLELIVNRHLPDLKNIRHSGYVILAHSRIHRIRAQIGKKTLYSRGLNKKAVKQKWQDIIQDAWKIPNVADRVFVLSLIAIDMAAVSQSEERATIKDLLDKVHLEISNIPTVVDRIERIIALAEAWDAIKESESVRYLLTVAVESANNIRHLERDEQLRNIIQVANKLLGNDFTTTLLSKIDTYREGKVNSTKLDRTLQVDKLSKNPSMLNNLKDTKFHDRRNIIGSVAERLLSDMVIGMGRGVEADSTVFGWLRESTKYDSWTSLRICSWVSESAQRGASTRKASSDVFFVVSEFAERLTAIVEMDNPPGIPEAIHQSISTLSSKYVSFLVGESEKANTWIANWLKSNVRTFVKIVDPYFDLVHVSYLNYIPEGAKAFIITTDKNLPTNLEPSDLERFWREHVSNRSCPYILIMIVPNLYDNKFHDRVIISDEAGLDLGPSLNTFGTSRVKLAILSHEESQQLDASYVQRMLNSTNWLIEQNVHPIVINLQPFS